MTTYLLAIGINQYTDRAFRALSCCENDATELHSLFKRNLDLGDRARKLVGAVSIADVKNELRRIGQEIRNGDTFVFFFAGHGYQHPRKEDQYLLFPDAEAVLVNKGHRDGMLALSALRDLTEHWTGVARVFILDACRSWLPGRGAEGARFDNEVALAYLTSRSPGFSPEVEESGDPANNTGGALPPVILNATRNGQEAKELENRQRGVLALALEQSLENQQQSGQVIYLGERLLGDISQRMNELLQHGRLGVEQTPFLTPPTAQVLLFKPSRPAATTPPVADEDDDETDWAITCAKGRLEDYESYARRKPPGQNLTKALEQIARLSLPEPAPSFRTRSTVFVWPIGLGISAIIVAAIAGIATGNDEGIYGPKIKPSTLDRIYSVFAWGKKPDSPPLLPPFTPFTLFRDKLKGGGEGPAMVVIPAGEFDMGSDDSDSFVREAPIHPVSIKQSIAIGQTEVTQKEWRQVMGSDPAELHFKNCDNCPVESVSWNDAQSYIKKLNELIGKISYRLPSEAEWEYACRGGKVNEKYCGGNDVDSVAWYDDLSGRERGPRPVAQKQANAYGLHDMSGNVSEWVEDWYHDRYFGAPQDGSAWVTGEKQKTRGLRGGSFSNPRRIVRSAFRGNWEPDDSKDFIGFRVARTLP